MLHLQDPQGTVRKEMCGRCTDFREMQCNYSTSRTDFTSLIMLFRVLYLEAKGSLKLSLFHWENNTSCEHAWRVFSQLEKLFISAQAAAPLNPIRSVLFQGNKWLSVCTTAHRAEVWVWVRAQGWKNRKETSSVVLRSYLVPVPRTALGVNRSGFECHGGNPQSNKTKWGCIDALSCFIWWLEINEL